MARVFGWIWLVFTVAVVIGVIVYEAAGHHGGFTSYVRLAIGACLSLAFARALIRRKEVSHAQDGNTKDAHDR